MFARMGMMFSWATPEYMLDHMTFDQIVMYHEYGVEYEKYKADILVNKIGVNLLGAKEKPKSSAKPDKKGFYRNYARSIKTPSEGENT